MLVVKRDGSNEDVSFDKVLTRIKVLSDNLRVNAFEIAQKVCARIFNGVKTTELDELTAQMCSSMIVEHPDYGTLAARIAISNHHKNTSPSFSETIQVLYGNVDVEGIHSPLISAALYEIVQKHKEKLNSYLDYSRDYTFDYFGFKTLEKSYLMKVNNKVVERPQHLWMRVALGIHGGDFKDALQTYDYMSKKFFTHATPTLFNAGTPRPQCSSCFLMGITDSIDGIFETVGDCAKISKYAGGIGMHIHDIRCKGSRIRGTNGRSDGIIPMLRVFNNTARYVNQCFTPDTLVYTKHGTKCMSDVTTEDELITLDGTFKRVNSVSVQSVDKEILEITTEYSFEGVKVTPEHEIMVLRAGQQSFVPAKELCAGDLVGYPIPTHQHNDEEIESDFCRYYGLMVSLGKGNPQENTYEMQLPQASGNDTTAFIQSYLGTRSIAYTMDSDGTTLRWSDERLSQLGIYDSNNVKHIIEAFLHLSEEKTFALLEGILEPFMCNDVEICFVTRSHQVAMSLRYLLLRVGVLPYGTKSDTGVFEIRISKDNVHATTSHGMIWSRVKKIETIHYSGDVYDFNMMDNHNYTVANLGLVHNSGKRNGSIAVYLEPWHGDIENFLDLRKNHGHEEERCRDLFLALWIPDLFMERVRDDGVWSLMCPDASPGLSDAIGDDFKIKYEQYERDGRYLRQIRAQELWFKILESQIESGVPYILYKDAANKKSNQQNLGAIKSSNLCQEIIQYTSPEEVAVCNLASLGLPMYIDKETLTFDFKKLHDVTKIVTKNLNKIIDRNYYPLQKARTSNLRHRPIGIGVQGLADVFAILRLPFESDAAKKLNVDIFETIYHASLEASMEISKKRHETYLANPSVAYADSYLLLNEFEKAMLEKGTPFPGAYVSFEGSPTSKGVLQFDMWGVEPSDRYDWGQLKSSIMEFGLRNSLLVAPMPTASTAQILGNNESFEPFTSNLFKRKTLSGEFIVINKYLLEDLISRNLWSKDLKDLLVLNDGSVQNIDSIPEDVKALYKTVWEIKQKHVIDMAADRGAFIDQSQSLNLFLEDPEFKKLTSMHFYSWQKGLKCGVYYLRTRPKSSVQKFTIDPNLAKLHQPARQAAPAPAIVCTDEVCIMCSS